MWIEQCVLNRLECFCMQWSEKGSFVIRTAGKSVLHVETLSAAIDGLEMSFRAKNAKGKAFECSEF